MTRQTGEYHWECRVVIGAGDRSLIVPCKVTARTSMGAQSRAIDLVHRKLGGRVESGLAEAGEVIVSVRRTVRVDPAPAQIDEAA